MSATATLFPSHSLRGTAAAAINHLNDQGIERVWLDCVYGDGALLRFYGLLGFEQVARKSITYSTGPFDMVLMRCILRTANHRLQLTGDARDGQ